MKKKILETLFFLIIVPIAGYVLLHMTFLLDSLYQGLLHLLCCLCPLYLCSLSFLILLKLFLHQFQQGLYLLQFLYIFTNFLL